MASQVQMGLDPSATSGSQIVQPGGILGFAVLYVNDVGLAKL